MITVDVRKAKRRFGIKPRSQWKLRITAENGRNLSTQDTYANPGDIVSMLTGLRRQPMQVRIHHNNSTEVIEL